MALPMDEQRILDEIERGLASTDPRLAARLAAFGAPRGTFTLKVRRLRLLASLSTLLVVAAASLVVYAVMPFRAGDGRHAGPKASASPAQQVMTAPSHAAGRPAAQASTAPATALSGSAASRPSTSPTAGAGVPSQATSSAASQLPHAARTQ